MATTEELAARLRAAYAGPPIATLRDGLAANDVDGAYAIQAANTSYWVAGGRRIAGRKVGLTAEAVQRQFGVHQPDYGVLFDDMVLPDGSVVARNSLLQPKIEGEVALVMGRDLDNPRANLFDVLAAAAYALPAIEIVDSRIADWKITIADTIADNASAAFIVLGTEARSLAGLDLFTCGMILQSDGKIVSTGVGAACLGNPLNAAAWLARTLSARGEPLRSGDIIMTGALGPMVSLQGARQVRLSIGGLGSVGFVMGEA